MEVASRQGGACVLAAQRVQWLLEGGACVLASHVWLIDDTTCTRGGGAVQWRLHLRLATTGL